MTHFDKQLRLSAKVQQDLLERSRQGIWAYPVFVLLVLSTTALRERAPILAISLAVCVALQASARFILVRRLSAPGRDLTRDHRLQCIHLGVMLSCSAAWGVVAAFALGRFGYQDKDVLVLLLYVAVIAFATVNLLVHDQTLATTATAFLFAPLIAAALLRHGPGTLNSLGTILAYLLYCTIQGKKLNCMYLGHISDNYELSIAAYRDTLTGMPNRLYMNQALEECFDEHRDRRDPAQQVALLYIDLDGFKQINDRFSHKVGDLFLCEAATRINRSLRKGDVAARIGGDEFTILLPDCASEQDAIRIASRVLHDARVPIHIGGNDLTYSASIGVSLFSASASTAETLVQTADEAMYRAKASGKDRICISIAGGRNFMLGALRETSKPWPGILSAAL